MGTKAYRLLWLLKLLEKESLYPNVEFALWIYLNLAIVNYSGEISFSALRWVNNCIDGIKINNLNMYKNP